MPQGQLKLKLTTTSSKESMAQYIGVFFRLLLGSFYNVLIKELHFVGLFGVFFKFCVKCKIIVLPKEMLLSFSIATFLTNYAESLILAIILHCTKMHKNERRISQWRLLRNCIFLPPFKK